MNWPPNYNDVLTQRATRLEKLQDPVLLKRAKQFYSKHPADFISDWMITYDPRAKMKVMPFILFPRQRELVEFLYECYLNKENGLIEKCRDFGATFVSCGFSIWMLFFVPGSSVGWGSRKEILVDRLGVSDSIFEKLRMMINKLPSCFKPEGFSYDNMNFMKIINPKNGASIIGEAGDNIGRGGRTSIYFKDEAAYYPRPELVEAALGDNTDVQIDISSVNGTANVFYRRRHAGEIWEPEKEIVTGKTRVLILDWREHPAKTQAWYDRRRVKAEEEGLLHLFAQEVYRDYSSAVTGIVIPTKYVKAAIDAHKKLGFEAEGMVTAALDVADEEGQDKNALAIRKGVVLQHCEHWAGVDTGITANRAVDGCEEYGATELYYDSIGVGAGVRGETNRLKREGKLPKNLKIYPWCASAKPLRPDKKVNPEDSKGPTNRDFYANLKAQGWWQLRLRFERTYKAVVNGIEFNPDDLISIPSDLPNRHAIENELSQATYIKNNAGKIVINKTPVGSMSPNLADAIVMDYHPCKTTVEFKILS